MSEAGSERIGGAKQLLAEEVFRHIGAAIISGELAPRQRIRDVDLAMELHVSRTPVREALQRLERIGMVVMYPSRYTEVSAVTDDVRQDSHEFAGYQSGVVAHLAAQRMSPAARETAAALVDELIAAVDDPVRASSARRELFTHLSVHSGNVLQHRLLDEASLALARNLRGMPESDASKDERLQNYAALRQALLSGDRDVAERAARAMHGVV